MDSTALGKRLKKLGLRKNDPIRGSGDFITRNMLSQIESGTAYPSVKTLNTRKRFGDSSPVVNFLSETTGREYGTVRPSDYGIRKRKSFLFKPKLRRSSTMLKLFSMDDTHPIYEESCALMARALLKLAEKKRLEGMISSATDHANHAQEYSKKGIYAGREIRTAALLLLDRLADDLDPTAE